MATMRTQWASAGYHYEAVHVAARPHASGSVYRCWCEEDAGNSSKRWIRHLLSQAGWNRCNFLSCLGTHHWERGSPG